jgi:hypothetical protein
LDSSFVCLQDEGSKREDSKNIGIFIKKVVTLHFVVCLVHKEGCGSEIDNGQNEHETANILEELEEKRETGTHLSEVTVPLAKFVSVLSSDIWHLAARAVSLWLVGLECSLGAIDDKVCLGMLLSHLPVRRNLFQEICHSLEGVFLSLVVGFTTFKVNSA